MAKGDKHSLSFHFESPEDSEAVVPGVPDGSPPADAGLTAQAPAKPAPKAQDDDVALSVAELNRTLRALIETPFNIGVWVQGEVSQPKLAPRGHLYFTLKDEAEDACVDCVIYKTQLTPALRGRIKDGDRVRLRGKPSYWPVRGRLQFVADRAEATGKGALLEALEKLKAQLASEGLFAAERKRALPSQPRIIGVVTSRTGAVVHDIHKVAFRRGGAHLLIAPATVQGAEAAGSVRRALAALQKVQGVDVIILARGGGSWEDLMCFNDEQLVRAIAASPVPIVSAIGHETDVTLADFAADARAATPSQAAELVVPDRAGLAARLLELRARLARSVLARVTERQRALEYTSKRLGDPRRLLAAHQTKMDDLQERARTVVQRQTAEGRRNLARYRERLLARHPGVVLSQEQKRMEQVVGALRAAMMRGFTAARSEVSQQSARLDALSPLRVLARGYALVTSAQGAVVKDAVDVAEGQEVSIRLSKGTLDARVIRKAELS